MKLTADSHERHITERARFDLVRYANCWEDADVLVQALEPERGSRILSIASGGDNSFSLLARGACVVAIDLSQVQLAVVELKRAAFREFSYETLLSFLGVNQTTNRRTLFETLRPQLTDFAQAYWSQRFADIDRGIIHAGKFEHYFHLFRHRVLPLIHSRNTVRELLEPKTLTERRNFWDRRWNSWRWRMLCRLFFSRAMMGRIGRDPEFFRYADGSISEQTMERARHAFTELSTHDNSYLTYIATGNFVGALPDYLRPENYAPIRNSIDRLELVHGSIEEYVAEHDESFDGMNLSDIFEYMSEEESTAFYGQLLDRTRPGAHVAYWQTFVTRNPADRFTDRVEILADRSSELFLQDKAFFYRHFQVDEVRATPTSNTA